MKPVLTFAKREAKQRAPEPLDPLAEEIAQAARYARQHAIAAIYHAGSGHPGGALSAADILACLFGAELNFWPSDLSDPVRDRFVLSKGHGAPAFYAVAAHYGFCGRRNALALRKTGSPFQGLPHSGDLSWVETSTGSPGQGFSVALGMAMGLKIQKNPARVYVLLGDGEMQEGEVWEAAMCASHHRLDNLCVIVDCNRPQNGGSESLLRLEPVGAKWRAFDWAVADMDGHSIPQMLCALRRAAATHGRPSVLIAHTVSGKGVPHMEHAAQWHGSVKLTRADAEEALAALGAGREDITELLDAANV